MHVYGKFEVIDDQARTVKILREYVAFYEQSMPKPWNLDQTGNFVESLAKSVVAFQIAVVHMEGKWKLNQNHAKEKRKKVIEALSQYDDTNSREIAGYMAEWL